MNQDREHLKLLSIFYYIGAALAALCACAPLIFLPFARGKELSLGLVELSLFGVLVVVCGVLAVCQYLTGKYLVEKSHYNFCFVMACIVACLSVPLGTVLGVLTVLVLLRPSVKSLFGVLETPVPAQS